MKIVVIEPLAVEEKRFLEIARAAVGQEHEIVCYDTRTTDVKELGERGKDADIIALGNLPFPREVLEQCENLKMLAVAFTGLDHVDLAYCEERGIKVQNCAGYATTAVAELTFGLMLDVYRNILPCDEAARAGGTKDGLVGFELEGKTIGVVGTGAIGARVIELAEGIPHECSGLQSDTGQGQGCGLCSSGRAAGKIRYRFSPRTFDAGNEGNHR